MSAPSNDNEVRRTILVVEDEPTLATAIAQRLTNEGWTARVAGDGATAVKAADKLHPDLIIMDLMLPVMDGIAATQAIRGLDRADAATVPILAMTANAFAEDIERSRKAGMNEHLAKPIEPETLYARLASYFR